MSCCTKEELPKGDTETQNLRRQVQRLQDTITEKMQIIHRLQQERSKLTVDQGLEKQKIIAESTEAISKVKSQLNLSNNQISQLQRKENRFKDGYEKDIFNNLKTIKTLQQQIMTTNDLNRLEELSNEKDVDVLINFSSLSDFYLSSNNRFASLSYSPLETNCKEIYLYYTTALFQERKLVLCVGFYVDFLQKVIQNGYDESDDSKSRTAKETMQRIAEDLYKNFQEVIKIAKIKFTKERSRILQAQEVDNSHQELKLREKINSLQKVIENKDLLIKELQGYSVMIERYEKITIPNLKEQIKGKETQQIKEIKSILDEVRSNMVQKGDIVGMQRKMEGEAPYQEAELIESIKKRDLKIQELQQKVFQLEKTKSVLSEETLSQSKRITNEAIEKDKEIGILKERLEKSEEDIKRLASRQSSLTREMAEKEERFSLKQSALNKGIDTKLKENAELVQIIQDLQKKKESEEKELQQLAAKLTLKSLDLDESSKKIQSLQKELLNAHSELQSFKKQQFLNSQQSLKEDLSKTLQSSLQQTSKEQELTHQIQATNVKVVELTRLLSEKESQLIDQSMRISEANLRADKAESRQQQLEEELIKSTKQHNKTRDLLNEANRSLYEISDQKAKTEHSLQLAKIEQQRLKSEERATKNKLLQELQKQKQLAKALQLKLQAGGSANLIGRFRSASFVEHRTLFIGNILEKRKPEKKFLMDSIESHMKQDIEKTNKLYEFKRDQKTNFHQYIDGHSNIVLIIETESALIACYYSGMLQTQTAMDEQALIISLDSRKVYRLNNIYNYPNRDLRDTRIMRGMVYDPYYLIFGNAEVRIRSGDKTVFCNLGINNSYFNSERDRAADLLKVKNKNEVEFINYEIHEIFFNEEYMLQRLE